LSFLIVWCFLSFSLTHSHPLVTQWKDEENFSYQLIILIVNKTNSDKSLNSPNASLSCYKFVCCVFRWASFASIRTSVSITRLCESHFCTFPVRIVLLKKMNVIKCDFHQREIWYVYRLNGLSNKRREWNRRDSKAEGFQSSRNIEISFILEIPFAESSQKRLQRSISKAKNMFKYLKTLKNLLAIQARCFSLSLFFVHTTCLCIVVSYLQQWRR
jgi:hypothetical protein